jgi:solute carrier family 36 (proton-coupled amino acid transporter)
MMVGFSCYAYEGIGVVLPIMQVCDCPEKFDKLLMYAFITLIIVYIGFGELCYITLGNTLNEQFITKELDQGSSLVIILQMIYSLNLLFSYSI